MEWECSSLLTIVRDASTSLTLCGGLEGNYRVDLMNSSSSSSSLLHTYTVWCLLQMWPAPSARRRTRCAKVAARRSTTGTWCAWRTLAGTNTVWRVACAACYSTIPATGATRSYTANPTTTGKFCFIFPPHFILCWHWYARDQLSAVSRKRHLTFC